MPEVVNLNRARKAKARETERATAASNRVKHGRSGAQKAAEAMEAAQAERVMNGHKRED